MLPATSAACTALARAGGNVPFVFALTAGIAVLPRHTISVEVVKWRQPRHTTSPTVPQYCTNSIKKAIPFHMHCRFALRAATATPRLCHRLSCQLRFSPLPLRLSRRASCCPSSLIAKCLSQQQARRWIRETIPEHSSMPPSIPMCGIAAIRSFRLHRR